MSHGVRDALAAPPVERLRSHAPSLAVGFLVVVAAALVAMSFVLGSLLRETVLTHRLEGAEMAANVFASTSRDTVEIENGRLTERSARRLDEAVSDTPELSAIRIWDQRHRLVHASLPALRAGDAAPTEEFRAAMRGEVESDFTSLRAEIEPRGEKAESFDSGSDVEVYLPFRRAGRAEPSLVLEAFLPYEQVRGELAAATRTLYMILGGTGLLFYLALLPTLLRSSRALAESRERRSPALQRRLRRAIRRDQLELHYQPKLDLQSGKVAGVEALLRWRLAEGRLAQPGEFLPQVEETEVMHRLTLHVMGLALRQSASWQSARLPLNVAINLSSNNVADEDLPVQLERLTRAYGISPRQVTLEVTETAAMSNAGEDLETLWALAARGFQLSIDDFGTGQSSLARLDQLPFSELKIDRSLIKRMKVEHEPALIKSIIGLSHDLDLRVVAEGVESEDVARRLDTLGCDVVQGYGIGMPVAPDEIPDLVSALEFNARPRARPRVSA
jgi:EAL domain-containing protein (putative c-di-GMP-specific phosphodiesterase class I)